MSIKVSIGKRVKFMSYKGESKVNTKEYTELLRESFRLTSINAEQIISPEND